MKNLEASFFLLVNLGKLVVCTKYFTRDDFIQPDFDWSQLAVAEHFFRNNEECSFVREEVTVFQFTRLSKKGKPMNGTVTVAKGQEVDIRTFFDELQPDKTVASITLRPRLNCYSQEDPRLAEAIKEHSLHPPSSDAYNLEGKHTLGDGQPRMLDQRYFHEKKKGGFFIEAGAFDGESESTTLHFELEHGWTGLLVEPVPLNFNKLVSKNRRAWSVQTCLSTKKTPETVNFSLSASSKATMSGIIGTNETTQDDMVEMQCLPLYSLLLSLGNPTVDFLSLDIEGAEFQVLKNIPWESVDIRAISVETQFAGEVMEGDKEDIFRLLTGLGYTHLDSIARDDIFVKLEPNQATPKLELQDFLQRRSVRRCSYYRVPYENLSDHCLKMYPLDYFSSISLEVLPECLTRNVCPYDWMSLLKTYRASASWVVSLSDGCMYVQ